jgi:ceramide glucosyltransferase
MLPLLWLILTIILTLLAAGGIAYYGLAIWAVERYRRNLFKVSGGENPLPPLSLLKPVCGLEPDLETNLCSFFTQDYPEYEILFAVRNPDDPAVPLLKRLMENFTQVPCRLLITGPSPYANAKVFSLEKLAEASSHEILIITDSDVSVDPAYLKSMAHAFVDEGTGAATSLYRGVGGADLWSKLEALGMSTEFMAGVIVAEYLEGMKFTIGPSMAITRTCLKAIGGFKSIAEYLADDFVMGEKAAAAGYRVILSGHAVSHHAYSLGFLKSFRHRLRWNRSSRYSRPAGYFGQGFTYGLVWALLLFAAAPTVWSDGILGSSLLLRLGLAYSMGKKLLKDPVAMRRVALIPLQDILSWATWMGGFLGREIVWRGQRYRLLNGGRFKLLS